MKRKNKRGQMFVWVIIALVIVVTIFFVIFARKQTGEIGTEENKFAFSIRECVKSSIDEATSEILEHGGFIETRDYVNYSDMKIEYLCKNEGYYESCMTLHPSYMSEIEEQFEDKLKEDVEKCFSNLKGELEGNKYIVEYGESNVDVQLAPGKIFAYINKSVKISREEEQNYNGFNFEFASPVHDLAEVAREIVLQESKYGSFDTLGYQIIHNEFEIDLDRLDDGSEIYTITEVNSGKKLNIAIRSVAVPPGI